jgi:hypothetical protein
MQTAMSREGSRLDVEQRQGRGTRQHITPLAVAEKQSDVATHARRHQPHPPHPVQQLLQLRWQMSLCCRALFWWSRRRLPLRRGRRPLCSRALSTSRYTAAASTAPPLFLPRRHLQRNYSRLTRRSADVRRRKSRRSPKGQVVEAVVVGVVAPPQAPLRAASIQ